MPFTEAYKMKLYNYFKEFKVTCPVCSNKTQFGLEDDVMTMNSFEFKDEKYTPLARGVMFVRLDCLVCKYSLLFDHALVNVELKKRV